MKINLRGLRNKHLSPFFSLLRAHPWRFLIICLFLIAVFFHPGQNRYQRQPLRLLPPLVRPLATSYAEPKAYPVESNQLPPPPISAKAALLIDLDSQTALFEKNSRLRLPPASTTKLMTAWVTRQTFDLDDIVIVPKIQAGGSNMNLVSGEKISILALLHGLLISSANDAALTLAEVSPGGSVEFISSMNHWAKVLKLNDTQFTNNTGIDEPNHYTSVQDLAQLSKKILQDPVIAEVVTQKTAVVKDLEGIYTHQLKNTNQLLLQDPNIKGLKTGWTESAGGCLVAYWQYGQRRLLSVILASADEQARFSETLALINWAKKNYSWEEVEPPASIQAFAIAGT